MKRHFCSTLSLIAFPLLASLSAACGDSGDDSVASGGNSNAHAGASNGAGTSSHAGQSSHAGTGNAGNEGAYQGPTVGTAQPFAALAYSAISAANVSPVTGKLGVSAGAMSKITGFDAAGDEKYGTDSLAPDTQRTILAQQDVTALVGDIDPRACDEDLTDVVGGLTGDITLHPGVTCMNSFSADVLLNGHVTLDAENDPNAFFIIRSNLTLTVADGAQVVLANGAQACAVFWRVKKQVTIGKTVQFYGTVIAGTAVTMKTGSTLVGRALAQTASIVLDANTITIPSDCSHLQ
jgi:ice-binding like protein